MSDQNKRAPLASNAKNDGPNSKEDQEILNQVNHLPISDREKNEIKATLEMYSGPIPHPKILAGYQALYPKAAEEIIENGLSESRHRRELETARQKRRGHLAWASMLLLVAVCLIFIAGSFYLILKGHTIVGSIFGGGSFITLAGSFLTNINVLSANDDISKHTNKESLHR